MKYLNKVIALLFIASFLSSIPFAFAENKSDIVKVTFELKVDDLNAKPDAPGGGKSPAAGYSIFAHWNVFPVAIVIDQNTIPAELTSESVQIALATGGEEWDKNTAKELFSSATLTSETLTFETTSPDGANEIIFAPISTSGVIAQTQIWYNRFTKEIVDFDMVFNTNFDWGVTGDTALMDVQNIATHELGHGFGLSDLYQAKWSAQTMYGYSHEGDIAKRDLAFGDIAGIKALYG
jgi:hypothetical protein